MYGGLHISGIMQLMGAAAGAGIGSTMAFAAFDLPSKGSGAAAAEASSLINMMMISRLLALSFIFFVVAPRLVVRKRSA